MAPPCCINQKRCPCQEHSQARWLPASWSSPSCPGRAPGCGTLCAQKTQAPGLPFRHLSSAHKGPIRREPPLSSYCWGSAKPGSAANRLADLMRPKRNQVQLSSKHAAASPTYEQLTCWKQRPLSLADGQALSVKNADAEFMPAPTKGA